MAITKKKPTPVKKTTTPKTKAKTLKTTTASANKKAPAKAVTIKKPAGKKVAVQKPSVKPVSKATSAGKKSKPAVSTSKPALKTDKSKKVNKTVKPVKATSTKVIKGAADKKSALKLSKAKPIIKNNPKPALAKKTVKAAVKQTGSKKLATMKKTEKKTPKETVNKKKPTIVTKAASAKKTVKPVKKAVAEKPVKKAVAAKPVKKAVAEKPVKKVVASKKISTPEKPAKIKSTLRAKPAKKEPKRTEKPFVMPKISTDKSREYKPAFVKSVLDQTPEEYTGPTMRYSDNELIEFRELITKKVETAKKELGYLQGLITRKDQLGGDENENRYMTMEDGGLSMEREQLSQMASRQISFIDHLEKAMMRIENKTYGICRVTGKLIDKARLRAVPHATLSIEAKIGRANANV